MMLSLQLSVGPEAKPQDLSGLCVLIINSYRTLKYPRNIGLLYIHTHLFLNLILIYLHFSSGIFSNLYIMKTWFSIRSQGTQAHTGCSSRTRCLHLRLPFVASAVSEGSHFPFWCLRPITFISDLTNRCSQTLFFMGCLPSAFRADSFATSLLRGTEK